MSSCWSKDEALCKSGASQTALLRDSSSGAAGFEAMSTSVEVAATHPLAMDIPVDARARWLTGWLSGWLRGWVRRLIQLSTAWLIEWLLSASFAECFRGWMGLWLFCFRDAQHGGKQKDVIRKFEKSFCCRDAQHGGKQKDIIRKFEN